MSAHVVPLPHRSDLPPDQRWDLERLFPTIDAFATQIEHIANRLAELDRFRGRLGTSAALLQEGLALRDDLFAELDRLRTYGILRMSEDATNADYILLRDRALGLQNRGRAAAAFIEPEIIALDDATLDRYFDDKPELGVYRYHIDTLRRRAANVRAAEIEALLADAEGPLGSFDWIYQALITSELRFGMITDAADNTVELQQNNRFQYLHSQDRSIREAAWRAYTDGYLSHRDTLAANLTGHVKANVFRAHARGYSSVADAALARQEIPRATLDTTIATVWEHFPVWQRYFRVRARLLGVDTASGWDISEMPIPRPGRPPIPVISYDTGLAMVTRALAPLGDAYLRVLEQAQTERWIDPLPNVGKFNGAFSSGTYLTPPYLLLNWAGDLAAVSVLAHELGHSVHSHLSWTHQPYIYGYYSDFVAEAVSNLHQFLLADHLMATTDDPDVLVSVIEERMGNSLRYLFNMPILAKFELAIHTLVERGDALTADGMIALMAAFYQQGYGDTVVLDRERMGIAWATYSHLYGSFYVYQYTTGIAAGAALARQIRAEGTPVVERLITLLKAGASADPIELLLDAGIDMRGPEPIRAAFDLLTSYIDRLEHLIG